ncbi:hypothetical protein P162_0164 [Bacteriophage T5-like cott162]|uniref:Uncharacterized protein n=4 Tax=Epseptimavirus saus132 TaxID=2732020 RepID=A0A2K8HFN3_9CAUD|nr:hypothetical protein P1301_0011 [Bacteriophage T5-like chee130_1]ASU02835.1 hypothetical protein P158_0011 [Bacteriophage T5-like chee158]ASU02990.1 hypothetical protein P162_0011 [Bacteriophage T5-like cott162]ASU03143.1 hypothetical protein P176N_0011 [Bacteriophage T5-like saus176N]AVG19480.1 hypothetical protein P1301_0166 [Bacteriophage T5-like chee130_1]
MKTLFSILLGAAGGFIATCFKSDPALLGVYSICFGYLLGRLADGYL